MVRAEDPRRAFTINGDLNRGTFPNRILALAKSLKIKGAIFARKLTRKLKVRRPIGDPAFAVIRICRRKHLPFCRFSICEVNSVRRVSRIKFRRCIVKRNISLVR